MLSRGENHCSIQLTFNILAIKYLNSLYPMDVFLLHYLAWLPTKLFTRMQEQDNFKSIGRKNYVSAYGFLVLKFSTII